MRPVFGFQAREFSDFEPALPLGQTRARTSHRRPCGFWAVIVWLLFFAVLFAGYSPG